jgi:phosphorylcholine metabolism protein LicD
MRNLLFLSLVFFVFSCKQNEEKVIISENNFANNEKVAKELLYILTTTIGEKWQIYIQKKQNLKSLLLEWLRTKIKRQIIKEYSELQNQFPDVQDSVVAVYPSGDKNVIVEFVSKGTLPDQSKFELPICTIFTIENGKITKDYTYFDNSK